MTNELVVVNEAAIMPVMDIQQAVMRRQAIIEFTRKVMTAAVDYGKIPGTTKATLLKPGAEKLTTLFGLSPRFEILEKELDWTGTQHGGEAFFYFQYRCSLHRGELLVGQGVGSCNSWEKKYRYRKAQLTCPECGKEAIIKGRQEYGGGWLCWQKRGGCGHKYTDGDPLIVNQEQGQVANDNPADLVNTLDKMAQKRALVAATLIAVNASEFFTQDVEDMDLSFIEGEYTESPPPRPEKKNGTKPSATKQAKSRVNDPEFWKEKAMGKTFSAFASCLINAGVGYEHEKQIEHALGDLGAEYIQDDTARLWDALIARKEIEAA